MNRPTKKHYPTDTQAGIRTLAQIKSLPSHQLTDEEFVKAFFDRFQAKALVMCYIDSQDQVSGLYGRAKHGKHLLYRQLCEKMNELFSPAKFIEVPEEEQ